jgi:hypothetical protein
LQQQQNHTLVQFRPLCSQSSLCYTTCCSLHCNLWLCCKMELQRNCFLPVDTNKSRRLYSCTAATGAFCGRKFCRCMQVLCVYNSPECGNRDWRG